MKTFKEYLNEDVHYSSKITAELVKLGWINKGNSLALKLSKVVPAGELSDGTRIATAQWNSPADRYLTAYAGFDTIGEIDGREYEKNPKKGASTFHNLVLKYYKK